jgi:uncharacterized membrane protein
LPEVLRDARPPWRAAAAAGIGLGVALVYPLATERALAAFGPRAAAAVVLAVGALSLVAGRARRDLPGPGLASRAALLVLPALALAAGRDVFLRLVPALLQALLAIFFARSLRGGGSLFEDAARIVQPWAPDFIRSYCRKATLVFAALFAGQAVALAVLVVRPPVQGWATASSAIVWGPLGALFAVEWAVRKAWFRHYGRNPVDRLLRILMPPERTERGRRSLAYIERMHQELGKF